MILNRESGLLMPVFSLPGAHGIGDFGPVAHAWIERLAAAGQSLWQILPLGPTGYGDSPYQSHSSHALNPLFISLDALAAAGLLEAEELEVARAPASHRIEYATVQAAKRAMVCVAARRFFGRGRHAAALERFARFVESEADWLDDFALYFLIKEQQEGRPWFAWPAELRDRDPQALEEIRRRHAGELDRVRVEQFWLREQWRAVRDRAAAQGVRIVGDLPIFVAHDSADVWARRDLFLLEPDGSPTFVAGVPPDYFSATGQLWGNPLYDWEAHQEEGFEWWLGRLGANLELFDLLRIDHFRGFAANWAVPGGAATAMSGEWLKNPGHAFFEAVRERFPGMPIIAEDLGVITPDVEALRDDFGLPGIRILQFAFGDDPMRSSFIPDAYGPNCFAYSGTHDNDTTVGWFNALPSPLRDAATIEAERESAMRYLGSDGIRIHWDFIHALLQSDAGAVVVPVQDVLGLGSEGRVNFPGTTSNNWTWRLADWRVLDDSFAELGEQTRLGRRGAYAPAGEPAVEQAATFPK